MSAANLLNTKAATYAAVAVVGALLVYVVGKRLAAAAPDAIAAAGQAVNPTNPANVFHSGVNAIGGAVSGRGSDWSLGSWVYDVFHDEYDPNAPSGAAAADERTWWENLKEKIW
jgi:hypothetical protein